MPANLIGLVGIVAILAIAVAFSSNRKAINLRVVGAAFGLQVVIEDYLHGGKGFVAMVVTKLTHFALAVAGIYAVIVVSVGAT